LNSFDTSHTGEELRGNMKDPELFGEFPGVRRLVGGEGTFVGCNQEDFKKSLHAKMSHYILILLAHLHIFSNITVYILNLKISSKKLKIVITGMSIFKI